MKEQIAGRKILEGIKKRSQEAEVEVGVGVEAETEAGIETTTGAETEIETTIKAGKSTSPRNTTDLTPAIKEAETPKRDAIPGRLKDAREREEIVIAPEDRFFQNFLEVALLQKSLMTCIKPLVKKKH